MLIVTHQTNVAGLIVLMFSVGVAFLWFIIALCFKAGREDQKNEKRWVNMHPVEKDPEDTLIGDHITVWRKKVL